MECHGNLKSQWHSTPNSAGCPQRWFEFVHFMELDAKRQGHVRGSFLGNVLLTRVELDGLEFARALYRTGGLQAFSTPAEPDLYIIRHWQQSAFGSPAELLFLRLLVHESGCCFICLCTKHKASACPSGKKSFNVRLARILAAFICARRQRDLR